VTEQEFLRHLELGHETRAVEFKAPGRRKDKAFLAKVARAVLGMANQRDGGYVIIGVEPETLDPVGLDEDDAAIWLNYDELAVSINEWATPSIGFDLQELRSEDRIFVVIHVHEFAEIPVLCRRDYQAPKQRDQILRRGACYVRAYNKPATLEIPTEEEMRELLELAIDKGVRKFVKRAQKVGLIPDIRPDKTSTSVEELFDRQAEEAE